MEPIIDHNRKPKIYNVHDKPMAKRPDVTEPMFTAMYTESERGDNTISIAMGITAIVFFLFGIMVGVIIMAGAG